MMDRFSTINMNISIDDQNCTTTDAQLHGLIARWNYDQLALDISIITLYTITTTLGLIGNSIVCYVVFTRKTITTTYTLIGNLAVSDILGSLTIPGQWFLCSHYVLEAYGDRGCGLIKTLQVLSYYISTFTMTVIAFDRYRLVYHPLSTRMKPWLPIAMIWTLSAICVSPTMISMRISEYFAPNRLIECRVVFQSNYGLFSTFSFRRFRVTFVFITQYAIPSTISIILYAFSLKKIILRKRLGEVTDQQMSDFYRSKRRSIKMLTIALLAFIIAWMPVHLIHFIDFYITPLMATKCNSSLFYLFFYWLAMSSCCFNPFIYCYLNNDFRSKAKTLLLCQCNAKCLTNQELIHSKSSPQGSNTGSNTGSTHCYSNYNIK